jgi:adenylate kinase family enzyme
MGLRERQEAAPRQAVDMMVQVQRVLVVGTAGSGKTTVAGNLARISGLPHIELDALRYERDWREVPVEAFQSLVESITITDCWIIDGNYAAVRELTWNRAQLVVWLDYPLPVVLRRLVIRTLRRLFAGTNTDDRNPERIGRLLGRHSILLWALRSHSPLRQEYKIAASTPRPSNVRISRHRSTAETKAWLDSLEKMAAPSPGLVLP